jgi:GNAT superfamily N-acetyltransferase
MDINKIKIRQLVEEDLSTADRMFRLAFGTFLGLPDPMTFFGDADYVKTRFLADRSSTLAAESATGELVGFNYVINWGSVGYFGPLVVHPDYWGQGIAKQLLDPTMNIFDKKWHTKHAGLFTFAQSPKHVGLYQKFGFWPRFLTIIMACPPSIREHEENNCIKQQKESNRTNNLYHYSRFSEIPMHNHQKALDTCRLLTNSVYAGLDLKHGILPVRNQGIGDTILLYSSQRDKASNNNTLVGLAVCHTGAGSEAGSNTCYIKFAAVRPGIDAKENFTKLLNATLSFAKDERLSKIVAGVNTERYEAYRHMLGYGFRAEMQGIAMHRPNESGYNRHDVYIIDDWR